MLEVKSKATALRAEAGSSEKFDDQLPHVVSDIVEQLGNLTVPLRSVTLIGNEVSQSTYNHELVQPRAVTSISDTCTSLSEQKLSPMERTELTLLLQEQLRQEIVALGVMKSSTVSIDDSERLIKAQETLQALGTAIVINNSRLGPIDRIRVPYELGGEFLSVKSTLKSLPSELRALVETLLNDDFSRRGEKAVGDDFRVVAETMSEYPLSPEGRQNLLKCIALTSKDLDLQSLALKEYFKNMGPGERSIVLERMLAVGKPDKPSLFLSHFQEHLKELFANHRGTWQGTSETLADLTHLARLVDIGSRFENIGTSVYHALNAVKGTIGVTDEVDQVSNKLSSLIAQTYGNESVTYRKFQLDFKLVEPNFLDRVQSGFRKLFG